MVGFDVAPLKTTRLWGRIHFVQFSQLALRLMLVDVWLGLHWASFCFFRSLHLKFSHLRWASLSFFEHRVQSSLSESGVQRGRAASTASMLVRRSHRKQMLDPPWSRLGASATSSVTTPPPFALAGSFAMAWLLSDRASRPITPPISRCRSRSKVAPRPGPDGKIVGTQGGWGRWGSHSQGMPTACPCRHQTIGCANQPPHARRHAGA